MLHILATANFQRRKFREKILYDKQNPTFVIISCEVYEIGQRLVSRILLGMTTHLRFSLFIDNNNNNNNNNNNSNYYLEKGDMYSLSHLSMHIPL